MHLHMCYAFTACILMKSLSIIGLHNASIEIRYLKDYIWQCFKNKSLFLTSIYGSVKLKLADFIYFFLRNAAYLTKKMAPNKSRRVRKIEVPTDSVPEFELGDPAVDI